MRLGVGITGNYNNVLEGIDRSGSTIGISVAYHKALGEAKNHHISFGVQGVIMRQSYSYHEDSNEIKIVDTHPNLNLGITYSGKLSERVAVYGGYSYYHVAHPVYDLGYPKYTTPGRHTMYAGSAIGISKNILLSAHVLYEKEDVFDNLTLGSTVAFALDPVHHEVNKGVMLDLGMWYRLGDALSPYVGLEWSKARFGLSYNVFTEGYESLVSKNYVFELSFVYSGVFKKGATAPNSWNIPRLF
jgi:hypothetical protein